MDLDFIRIIRIPAHYCVRFFFTLWQFNIFLIFEEYLCLPISPNFSNTINASSRLLFEFGWYQIMPVPGWLWVSFALKKKIRIISTILRGFGLVSLFLWLWGSATLGLCSTPRSRSKVQYLLYIAFSWQVERNQCRILCKQIRRYFMWKRKGKN